MTYTSFGFLAFLALVVLLYYLVPKRFQWCLLLAASYAFYLFSGIKQVFFIIATTLVSFYAGLIMQKMRDEFRARTELTKEEKRELKKTVSKKIHRVQTLAVLIDLGILVVVKYLNFINENLNGLFRLFRFDASLPFINIIVPLGISFYSFMSIGYLLDVGRGKYDAERHLGKFALFVSFFPSIVQGPISRFDDVGRQLQQEHTFDYDNLAFGAQLILWGFFKKLVIADRTAVLVSTIFAADPADITAPGSMFFFGVLAYAVQIYADFSGGIDITRGAAQILGIDLPQNFQRPYFSTSVADYWRRWHISLSNWMRDYVFYAIMLSKPVKNLSKFARKNISAHAGKGVPTVIPSFIVFLLIGIWHGADWRFVAFGLYNAIVVSASVALEPVFKWLTEKLRINVEVFSWRFFQIVRTFLLLCVPKLLVRSPSLRTAFQILKKIIRNFDLDFIFNLKGYYYNLGLDSKSMFVLFISLLVLLTVSILQESGMEIRKTIAKQNLYFRWGIYLLLLTAVLVFGMYGPAYNAADFIYQAY